MRGRRKQIVKDRKSERKEDRDKERKNELLIAEQLATGQRNES